MILSKKYIQKLLSDKSLVITPQPELKETSIKIHLGDKFSKVGQEYQVFAAYPLKPREFILALTLEDLVLPNNIAAIYDGFTRLARIGLMSHLCSMYVEPESSGTITLELFNASDQVITLEPGMRIGQLVLLEVKK